MTDKDAIQYRKELTKPVNKKFERRKAIIMRKNDIWTADIVDYNLLSKQNKNVKYLLCVLDIYSRYAFVFPLKDKTATSVIKCFKTFKTFPSHLWIDKGGEFLNTEFKKFCKEKEINMYHTYGEHKASYIERFNRTLKQKIENHFIEQNTNKYIDVLDDIMKAYNNTKHKSIDETTHSVYFEDDEPTQVFALGGAEIPKYNAGDYVRISRTKGIFEKGYAPKWSKEVFKIRHVDINQDPVMYQLEDLLGEIIDGKFYEAELQKTALKDYAMIEKVIKSKVVNGKKMYFVKYDGYDDKFNEWVDETKVIKRK